GDLQKTELRARRSVLCHPISPGCLKKTEGTDYIGLDEVFGIQNGTVHMTLRGKMHDGTRFVRLKQTSQQPRVSHIAMHENMARILQHPFQRGKAACV